MQRSLYVILIVLSGNFDCLSQETGPNVLILYTDQHRADVMGFMRHPDVVTPNLDRLAKSGIVFTRAYCQNAICTPSRSAMMSGIYPRTLGSLTNQDRSSVMGEVVSMATVFKQGGYRTYAFGKRHTPQAIDEGWDVTKSHIYKESPGESYVDWIRDRGLQEEFAMDWAAEFGRGPDGSEAKKTKLPKADMGTRLSRLPEDATMEAFTAQETIRMIERHAKSEKPFFCWASFYRPHQPYTPQKRFLDLYDASGWGEGTKKGDKIKMPRSLREPAGHLPPVLARQRNNKNGIWVLGKARENEQLYRNYIAAYYALVTEVDEYIGQILDALEANGLRDNTIIVYTSDHGDFVGGHGMIEKAAVGHNVFEETLRVPMIFSWEDRFGPVSRQDLVESVDIFPTLVDLAGVSMPSLKWPLAGRSLKNTLLRGEPVARKYTVSENWSQAAVITDEYKLGIMLDPIINKNKRDFRHFGDQFFVRSRDSSEVDNLINDPRYQAVITRLRNYYAEFVETVDDTGKREIIMRESGK